MELLNHKTPSFYVSCLPSKPSRLIRESLQLSKGHNHPNHVYYRLHLFAFSIFMSMWLSTSGSTFFWFPSICLGHIGEFSLEKCSLAIAMTFKPRIFVGQHWELNEPTAKSVGKSFALVQNSWSHGLLLKWLDFASENSLSNGKCDRTFRERLPRGHGFS